MTFFKVRIRSVDSLFTKYMKLKYNNTCVVCGRKHEPNSKGLGVSHYHGRRKENTRFDERNADLMCNIPCHEKWENEKYDEPGGRRGLYTKYMIKKLGEPEFYRLTVYANSKGYKDDNLTKLKIKAQMEELVK